MASQSVYPPDHGRMFDPPAMKTPIYVKGGEPVQDGLLTYYKTIAPLADANVEKRLETEPYAWPHFNKS